MKKKARVIFIFKFLLKFRVFEMNSNKKITGLCNIINNLIFKDIKTKENNLFNKLAKRNFIRNEKEKKKERNLFYF